MNKNIIYILLIFVSFGIFSGCSNTLIYGEQSGFNLSVKVDPKQSSPIKVNAGLERTVVTNAPPKETDNGEAKGEAASMFSNFNLLYDEETGPLQGKLTIQTRFASGGAALAIADDPDLVEKVVAKRSDPYANTDSTKRIGKWIAADRANNLPKLRSWVATELPGTSLLDFRLLHDYEQQRKLAINDLNIPN